MAPRFLVPVNSDVVSWKRFQIAFHLIVIQPNFKQRIVSADVVPIVTNTLPDVFPERAVDQSGGQLMKVLRKRPLGRVTQDHHDPGIRPAQGDIRGRCC